MVIILYLWYIQNGAAKLLLMAQPLKHPQSESGCEACTIKLRHRQVPDVLLLTRAGTHKLCDGSTLLCVCWCCWCCSDVAMTTSDAHTHWWRHVSISNIHSVLCASSVELSWVSSECVSEAQWIATTRQTQSAAVNLSTLNHRHTNRQTDRQSTVMSVNTYNPVPCRLQPPRHIRGSWVSNHRQRGYHCIVVCLLVSSWFVCLSDYGKKILNRFSQNSV